MARNLIFNFRRGGGSSVELMYGEVTLTPSMLHNVGTSAVIPAPTKFDLVAGMATATNVAPSPAPVEGKVAWAYKVKVTDRRGNSWEWLVGVPDGVPPINFVDLPTYYEVQPPAFGIGPAGPAGASATVAVGTVSSGAAPNVVNSGTSTNAIFDFTLEKGAKGDKGDKGDPGIGDDGVAGFINTPGSATDIALNAKNTQRYGTGLVRATGTNDQVAIQAAATAAMAVGGSGVVTLAEGTFGWDAAVTAWNKGFTLRGQGQDKTIIQLGTDVLFGPRWEGSSSQIGEDNVFATVAEGSLTVTLDGDYQEFLAPGDPIVLTSGALFAARSYYNTAEWAIVASVSPTTLTLRWPTRHSYNTADTTKIFKYNLISGVKLENLSVRAHPTTTRRQTLAFVRAATAPEVRNVKVSGEKATAGIDIWESWNPLVETCVANDVKDLANLVIGTWTGYGVRMWGTVDAVITDMVSWRCRHAFDDSTGLGLPPALRTQVVRGRAYNSVSSGWSTHGGSDECFFQDTVAVYCGGGFVVRGRAAKGRGNSVKGVNITEVDDYTALGGTHQSYNMGLLIGENGVPCPAGTGLDWEFTEVDMRGGSNKAHAVFSRYTDMIDARIKVGNLKSDGGTGVYIRSDKVRNLTISDGVISNKTASGRGVEVTPYTPGDGNNQKNLVIQDIMFDGYPDVCVTVTGNQVAGANASDRVVIRNTSAINKAAAYNQDSSVYRIEAGYFNTVAGAVEILGNSAIESTATAIKTNLANGGTGLGTSLTQKGNRVKTGYDVAP